jgi:hypothetical protein
VKIAKTALLAKIQFLQANEKTGWQQFLDKAALGVI